jgi:hypothetical protein
MPRKKSPVTQPGIDLGTLRLVAQRLNHYAKQIKKSINVLTSLIETMERFGKVFVLEGYVYE